MATSAIGPGFLTQTTVFTSQLLASFGFVILISILLDIGAQLNIWRILTMSEMRAQDLANKILTLSTGRDVEELCKGRLVDLAPQIFSSDES